MFKTKIKTHAFECTVIFLAEKRTELYEWYYSGVSQVKIWLGAENSRRAIRSADWRARMVRAF